MNKNVFQKSLAYCRTCHSGKGECNTILSAYRIVLHSPNNISELVQKLLSRDGFGKKSLIMFRIYKLFKGV